MTEPQMFPLIFSDTDTKRVALTPIEKAAKILSGFSLWQLKDAEVYAHECPDLSNPGGYYHNFVTLKYRSLFGFKRKKLLYEQLTDPDEINQQQVYGYAVYFLATVKTLLGRV